MPWRDGSKRTVGEAGLARLRTARHGFAPDPNCNAWVAMQCSVAARVISLSSVATPFDHVQCEEPSGSVSLAGGRFVFVYDVGDGPQTMESVNLLAD